MDTTKPKQRSLFDIVKEMEENRKKEAALLAHLRELSKAINKDSST